MVCRSPYSQALPCVALRRGAARHLRREWLRDMSNFVVPRDPVMRWVFRRADKLLVTRDSLSLVPPCWRHKCHMQLAIGLTSEYLDHVNARTTLSGNRYRLLMVQILA